MGGAFIALADDASASYWNPAGLHIVNRYQFEFMGARLPHDRSFNFFAASIPIRKHLTFGMYWSGLSISSIEGRTSNSDIPDFTFNNSQNLISAAFGFGVTHYLSVGAAVKMFRNGLHTESSTGAGFDASAQFEPHYRFIIGFLVQNITAQYSWQAGDSEKIPVTLKLGTAWKLMDNVTAVADIEKTSKLKPRFRIGAEVYPVGNLPVRIGFNENQIAGGVGFGFDVGRHNLEINYAYLNDRIFDEPSHRFSLVFTVGVRKSYVSRSIPVTNVITRKSQSNQNIVEVTANRLNVRSGPGTQFSILKLVKGGERFPAFEQKEDWIKIRLQNGDSGWVHHDFVREVSPGVE